MRARVILQRWLLCASLCVASVPFGPSPLAWAQAPASPSDSMSVDEMARDAASMLASMLEAQSYVEGALQAEVEEADNAQRAEYVEQRLTAIRGFVRVAEEALQSLTANSGGERSEAVHHWNLVFVSSERVRILTMQVEQYSGALSRYTGDTVRTPNIDPRIPALITWLMDEYWVFDDPLLGAVLSEASVSL
jgi:hypothetical protein